MMEKTWKSLKFTSVPFFFLKCENFTFGLRKIWKGLLSRRLVSAPPSYLKYCCDEAAFVHREKRNGCVSFCKVTVWLSFFQVYTCVFLFINGKRASLHHIKPLSLYKCHFVQA